MPVSLYDNSTIPTFREVNTVALNIVQESSISAGVAMIEISLSSLLFGELSRDILPSGSLTILTGTQES